MSLSVWLERDIKKEVLKPFFVKIFHTFKKRYHMAFNLARWGFKKELNPFVKKLNGIDGTPVRSGVFDPLLWPFLVQMIYIFKKRYYMAFSLGRKGYKRI